MRKNELLAKFTFERSSDAIFWVNSTGRFQSANKTACTYLGYTREELLHMSVSDISPAYSK